MTVQAPQITFKTSASHPRPQSSAEHSFPPAGERISALGEALAVMKAVWTEPNPVYAGRFCTSDGGSVIHQTSRGPPCPGHQHSGGSHPKGKRQKRLPDRRGGRSGREPATLRLSVATLLASTESAEQEAEVRNEFASTPKPASLSGHRRNASSES